MTDFVLFQKNRDYYKQLTYHSKDVRVEITKRVNQFDTLNEIEQQHELDLYHDLLKHARVCDDCIVALEPIERLLIKEILPKIQTVSYPLLVCMIDIVKNGQCTIDAATQWDILDLTLDLWRHDKVYMCRKSMELCKRMIPLLESGNDLLLRILDYIKFCSFHITQHDLERFKSVEYTEFFHTFSRPFDRECIKLIVQITLAVFLHLRVSEPSCIHEFIAEIKRLSSPDHEKNLTALFDMCCANDDDTVQLLDTVLTLHQQETSLYFLEFLQDMNIDPHSVFLFFLSRCGNDHSILIDLLLDMDSDFLSYFHRYIVFATQDIENLANQLEDDTLITIIANTILVLERGGFPYNTIPLVRRLVQFEHVLNQCVLE